jgi:predicted amidophosphoribosyltransferase
MTLDKYTNNGRCQVCWGPWDRDLSKDLPCPACGLAAHGKCSYFDRMCKPKREDRVIVYDPDGSVSSFDYNICCQDCVNGEE